MSRNVSLSAALGLALGLLAATCVWAQAVVSKAPAAAPPPAPAAAIASTPGSGDRSYVLGFGDVIEVSVLGRTDFNVRGRIGSDGAILLPLLGPVGATGKSPGQLADEIRAALEKGGFYASPFVRVDVVTVSSRYATVLGYVGSPGLIPLDRDYRLSELIARVGGKSAAGADFAMLTRQDGEPVRYNLADLATATREKDPVVMPGDKVYVPAAENEVFYLNGQVKSPGAYPVSANLTLRMAIARAGGVGENGSEKKVKVVRGGSELKGVKIDETTVKPGDVVTVGERLF